MLLGSRKQVKAHIEKGDQPFHSTLCASSSVYKAVELCAFELYDDIDYDTWYQTQLLTELQIHDPR